MYLYYLHINIFKKKDFGMWLLFKIEKSFQINIKNIKPKDRQTDGQTDTLVNNCLFNKEKNENKSESSFFVVDALNI